MVTASPLSLLSVFGDDQVGFMDLEGNLVVPQCFTTAYPFNEGLALVGFWESPGQERFGFINQQAEFVFPPAILKDQLVLNDINSYYQYGWKFPRDHDHGQYFSSGRFPLRQLSDNKIGFIDSTGKFAIAPQFDSVGGFHEGVSRVCETFDYGETDDSNQRCGYVHPDGRWAMPLQLAQASSFYDGIAQIRFPGTHGRTVINNKTFEPLIPSVIKSLGHTNTVGGGGWQIDSGLVNVLLPGCRYDSDEEYPFMGPEPPEAPPLPVDEYGEEGYEYWNPGPATWGYIDVEKGGYEIEPRFCDQGFIDEGFFAGRAIVRIHRNDPDPSIPDRWKGRMAMIDTTGQVIDNFGEEYTPDFLKSWQASEEGLLAINAFEHSNKDGYIDQDGYWAIPPAYRKTENFREGLAVVGDMTEDGPGIGFIDSENNVVVPLRFRKAGDFSQGLAVVQQRNTEKWGFIDRQGEWDIEPKFDVADSFTSSGIAKVKVNNFSEIAVIDKQGEYVIPPTTDFDYNHSFKDLGNGITLVTARLNTFNAVHFVINKAGKVLPYTVASLYRDRLTIPHFDNGLEAGLIIVGEALSESFNPIDSE